ncbi:TVP38/TMEM64 family protein [Lyngbya confervoides]|uniref:TVP38/TMEM64 family membrane protein n=1 Tax=Lyngbya confervoides BDU141951 TaxID=1574623 RepID=A0ABD4T6C4_9CYAN|nr:TVP38/TMEM64 family protein [Lyngbya confervoides]MCM1984004.1 TVP38/TMEM64 family protein [Lyngbya confervoides BDU141951]
MNPRPGQFPSLRGPGDPAPPCQEQQPPLFPLISSQRAPQLLLWFLMGLLALPGLVEVLPVLWDSQQLTAWLDGLGPKATVWFVGLHIGATAIGIPGVILTLVGGVCFGLVWGSVWSVLGATLGALAAFSLARYLMHGWWQRRFGHHALLKSLNRMVKERPFWFVLTLRFAPISPFNLTNFLLGLTPLRPWPYTFGTLIGIMPGVVLYTWLGQSGYDAFHGQGWISFLGAGSALALLSLLPLLLRRRPG